MTFYILHTEKVYLRYELSDVNLSETFVWKTFHKYYKQSFSLQCGSYDESLDNLIWKTLVHKYHIQMAFH